MGINRLSLGAFNTKVFCEKIKEKRDPREFDDILQEEHSKLMQVVSKMEKNEISRILVRNTTSKKNIICHLVNSSSKYSWIKRFVRGGIYIQVNYHS